MADGNRDYGQQEARRKALQERFHERPDDPEWRENELKRGVDILRQELRNAAERDWAKEAELERLRKMAEDGHWSNPTNPRKWGKRFGVSARTFVQWCESNKIRHYKMSDRLYRIDIRDLPPSGNIRQ